MPAKSTPRSRPATRRLASITSAAEYLDVSDKTIRRYISQGLLTGYRVGNHLIRIDLDEVDAVLTAIPGGGHVT